MMNDDYYIMALRTTLVTDSENCQYWRKCWQLSTAAFFEMLDIYLIDSITTENKMQEDRIHTAAFIIWSKKYGNYKCAT